MKTVFYIALVVYGVLLFSAPSHAQKKCQTFKQENGKSKTLCQDGKGRWVEVGKAKKRKWKKQRASLARAKITYEGTYSWKITVPPPPLRSGDLIKDALHKAMNSKVTKDSGSMKMATEFTDQLVKATDSGERRWGANQYTGFRRRGTCKLTSGNTEASYVLEGPCDERKFKARIKGKTSKGYSFSGTIDLVGTGYVDLFEKENRRLELQQKCAGGDGDLTACVELENYKNGTSAKAPPSRSSVLNIAKQTPNSSRRKASTQKRRKTKVKSNRSSFRAASSSRSKRN